MALSCGPWAPDRRCAPSGAAIMGQLEERMRPTAPAALSDEAPYENAWMPVCARPRMRAWTSWVPS